jgi:hypothetical protein
MFTVRWTASLDHSAAGGRVLITGALRFGVLGIDDFIGPGADFL